MLAYYRIKKLLTEKDITHSVIIKGWVTDIKPKKIIINDGSHADGILCHLPENNITNNKDNALEKGSSIVLCGLLNKNDKDYKSNASFEIEKILEFDLPFIKTSRPQIQQQTLEDHLKEAACIRIYSNLQFSIQQHLEQLEYYSVNPILYKPIGIYTMQLKNVYWIDTLDKQIHCAMGFCDISNCMDRSEELLKHVIKYSNNNCKTDLEILRNKTISKKENKEDQNLHEQRINQILQNNFTRVSYTEAIEILKEHKKNKILESNKIQWGNPLTATQEEFLCNQYFSNPIIIFDFPINNTNEQTSDTDSVLIKHNDNTNTIRKFHIILPQIGKVIWGFQYEENPHIIKDKIKKHPSKEQTEIIQYIKQHPNYNCKSSSYTIDLKSIFRFMNDRIKD